MPDHSSLFLDTLKMGFDIVLKESSIPEPEEKLLADYARYYDFLMQWSKVYNLTRDLDVKNAAEKLFIDSYMITSVLTDKDSIQQLVDIGSGAGFPSLVLLLKFKSWQGFLFEKVHKKTAFLQFVSAQLNCSAHIFNRVFNFKDEQPIASGNCVLWTSRATFSPKDWLEYSIQASKAQDQIIIESIIPLRDYDATKCQISKTCQYQLPFSRAPRTVSKFMRL